MQRSRWALIIGGFLMAGLGFLRGAGGFVLLTRGAMVDANIQATNTVIAIVGTILLLLGAALIVAAAGVFRGLRAFWRVGIVCTILFVADGAINGFLLYGRPGRGGTAANTIAAALILVCLLLGRGGLRGHVAQHTD